MLKNFFDSSISYFFRCKRYKKNSICSYCSIFFRRVLRTLMTTGYISFDSLDHIIKKKNLLLFRGKWPLKRLQNWEQVKHFGKLFSPLEAPLSALKRTDSSDAGHVTCFMPPRRLSVPPAGEVQLVGIGGRVISPVDSLFGTLFPKRVALLRGCSL